MLYLHGAPCYCNPRRVRNENHYLDALTVVCIIMHVSPMNAPASPNSKVASLHRTASIPDGDFLLFLGKRVRQLRNLRGMTRKMVARESDVSERHLAQLEAGEGNVSIVLLRRIAAALNVSLIELFTAEVEEPAEKQMIRRFLERLPNHRLEDVVFRLMRDFGPGEKVRRKRIALIGLRGEIGRAHV